MWWMAKSPKSWDFTGLSQKFSLSDLWCSFFFSFGAKFIKNHLFHVHICLLPQILGFMYQATDNQAVLAENQSIFVQKALAFPMGTVVFQYLLLPFSFQDQLLLQPAAPRVCSQVSQTESGCAKLEKSLDFGVLWIWVKKKLRWKTKHGKHKGFKGQKLKLSGTFLSHGILLKLFFFIKPKLCISTSWRKIPFPPNFSLVYSYNKKEVFTVAGLCGI